MPLTLRPQLRALKPTSVTFRDQHLTTSGFSRSRRPQKTSLLLFESGGSRHAGWLQRAPTAPGPDEAGGLSEVHYVFGCGSTSLVYSCCCCCCCCFQNPWSSDWSDKERCPASCNRDLNAKEAQTSAPLKRTKLPRCRMASTQSACPASHG